MADNYLEKKMEEHRANAGRCSSSRPTVTPRGNRPGEYLVHFTPCECHIPDITADGMTAIARELVAAGFKVTFRHTDIHQGTRLASTLEARFLPPRLLPSTDAITLIHNDSHILLTRGSTRLTVTVADVTRIAVSPAITPTIVMTAVMLANLNDFDKNVLKNIKIEGDSL